MVWRGIERGEWVLENHLNVGAQSTGTRSVKRRDVLTIEQDLAAIGIHQLEQDPSK